MFTHNLKIAFRNMRKYKNQTLISIIGLSVGFACFALATLWIRYEMTFDSFHKNAERIYVVYRPDIFDPSGFSRRSINPLAAYLKETFPEIEVATSIVPSRSGAKLTVEGIETPAQTIMADTSFVRIFDVKILEGSRDFLIQGNKSIAITREKARSLFGNEHPIGKTVIDGWRQELTICAIVSDMPKRSNYAFDFITPIREVPQNQIWNTSNGENTIIKLFSGVNVEAFEKKLYEHETGRERRNLNSLTIRSLTSIRYTDPNVARDVKFQHIFIFCLSGLLVVLCSLFNYLTLFISRFRIRQKELALRMVCGASGRSLLWLLSVEFILTLLFAVVLGCMMTQLIHKPFLTLSAIQMNLPAIFLKSLMYVAGIIFISLLAFWLILVIFRYRSLNLSIRRSNKKMFRKISVIVQLVISIGFTFCTIIIFKQMYFLHHTDELGFSFQNRGAILLRGEIDAGVLSNQLKQIPEITEVVNAEGMINLLPLGMSLGLEISSWDDKSADAEHVSIDLMYVSPEYTSFYDFQLLAGEMLTAADPDSLVLLNESAVKAFGWHNPVGKLFDDGFYTVKGVIRNIYYSAPTVEANPAFWSKRSTRERRVSGSAVPLVLFKYQEGLWKSCKQKIDYLIEKEYALYATNTTILNYKEEYDKFLKSETALIRLLSFVSVICVLICVFGFVSLVSLTCEERRKSIAIRKINGATAGDIIDMFAKEYFLLLIIGAVIAFTTGYFIMQRWLENYVKQTSIPVWIYLAIICVLALVIVLCVGWQVYRSSVENPAEVVKSE